jgi:hypothetical protein
MREPKAKPWSAACLRGRGEQGDARHEIPLPEQRALSPSSRDDNAIPAKRIEVLTSIGSMCASERSSVGRKPRRAHDRVTSLEQIAPGLSRSVALGSRRLVLNFKARFAPVQGKQHTRDTERS